MSTQQPPTDAPARRQTQIGKVTSVAGLQSVVVRIDRRVRHLRYQKFVNRSTKFMAHDERNECAVGDVVEIVASRPLSARKRWRVRTIVRRAAAPSSEAEA